MPEVQHYGDYGFDTQMDYFQEAGKKLDAVHLKLRKSISKDDCGNAQKSKKRRKWWKAACLFWKRDRSSITSFPSATHCCCCPNRADQWESSEWLRRSTEALWAEGIPYLSLMDEDQLRASASTSPAMPIYLVT